MHPLRYVVAREEQDVAKSPQHIPYLEDRLRLGQERTVQWLLLFREPMGFPGASSRENMQTYRDMIAAITAAGGSCIVEYPPGGMMIRLPHTTTPQRIFNDAVSAYIIEAVPDGIACNTDELPPQLHEIARGWNSSVEEYWVIRAMHPKRLARAYELEQRRSRADGRKLQKLILSQAKRTDGGPRF